MVDEYEEDPEIEMTDFDWVTSALAFALIEGITLEELEVVIKEAKNGEEFNAGVEALVDIRMMVNNEQHSF